MYLFAFFVVVVAVKSPLLQIVNLEFNSLGLMFDNIGKLLLATDPFTQSGFPQTGRFSTGLGCCRFCR